MSINFLKFDSLSVLASIESNRSVLFHVNKPANPLRHNMEEEANCCKRKKETMESKIGECSNLIHHKKSNIRTERNGSYRIKCVWKEGKRGKKQEGETEREKAKKGTTHKTQKNEDFLLETIQADGQKQEHSNSTYRDIQRNKHFCRKCAALIRYLPL